MATTTTLMTTNTPNKIPDVEQYLLHLNSHWSRLFGDLFKSVYKWFLSNEFPLNQKLPHKFSVDCGSAVEWIANTNERMRQTSHINIKLDELKLQKSCTYISAQKQVVQFQLRYTQISRSLSHSLDYMCPGKIMCQMVRLAFGSL